MRSISVWLMGLSVAYAKFAGDNSAMERAAKVREKADSLKALLKELE